MFDGILSNAVSGNWFIPTWDLLIFILFIVVSFIYGLSLGKQKISISLLCIYAGLAIISNTPYIDLLGQKINWESTYILEIITFWGIVILLFIALLQSPLAQYMAGPSGDWRGGNKKFAEVIVFSFLHIGLLTSITISFLPVELLDNLLPITKLLFHNANVKFIWLVSPMIALILLNRQTIRETQRDILQQ